MSSKTKQRIIGYVVVVLLAGAAFVFAQPAPGFSKTAPIAGTGSSGSPLRLDAFGSCGVGSAVSAIGSNGAVTCVSAGGTGDIEGVTAGSGLTGGGTSGTVSLEVGAGSGILVSADVVAVDSTYIATIGDITGVTAGTALTGGGTSGAVTLNFGCGTGLLCAADSAALNMTGASCSAGQYVSSISTTGDGTCTAEVGDISGVTATAPLSGGACTSGACTIGMSNGDRGDITQSTTTNAGDTWTIDNSAVTFAKIANIATARILGRVTASSGVIEELTSTQATTLCDTFSTSATTKGCVPGSNGGGASVFLNGAGAWTTPTAAADVVQTISGGTVTALGVNSTTTLLYWAPGGTVSLQGIANGAAGRRFKMVVNDTSLFGISIEAGGASAANRIMQGDALAWDFKGPVIIEFAYDTVNSRWTFGTVSQYMPRVTVAGTATVGGAAQLSSTLLVNGVTQLGDANADFTNILGKVYYSGTAPTLSSCTGGTIAAYSTDARGHITFDGTSTGACTLTFSAAHNTNKPACSLDLEDCGDVTLDTNVSFSSVSTSAFTIQTPIGNLNNWCVHYRCDGML